MKKIFISAGDPSGDIHAAKLMKQLKFLHNDCQFIGIGGLRMIEEGLKPITDFAQLNIVGFWEVAKKYSFFINLLKKCKQLLLDEKIDLLITIDYPGFNLKLAHFAKANSIKVAYYIAPQLWAWGKNRAEKLRNSIDILLVVFPFEVDYFKAFGINATFVGHPLMDDPNFQDYKRTNQKFNRIAILAGSRPQEIAKHSKLLFEVIELINRNLPDLKIGIALKDDLKIQFSLKLPKNDKIEFWDDSRELMKNSDIGLIKTGTSNLEASLLCLPFIMFYKASIITYLLGKNLINLPYISIINILQNKPLIKELIQKDANSMEIFNAIKLLTNNELERLNLINEFESIRKSLGGSGASFQAAKAISELL